MTTKKTFPHLLTLETLTQDDILTIINTANHFKNTALKNETIDPSLTGKVIALLFFEPSTRTANSFLIAAKRLNAITLNPALDFSSTVKGESLIDTVNTFEAFGTNAFIVRHATNHTAEFIAQHLKTSAHVINAGDGTNQHPTQALLDLMTIHAHKKDFTKLTVAIVGDINHSRVARSLVMGLRTMGVPDIRLVGPSELVNDSFSTPHIHVHHNLEKGIKDADVVVALRVQKERLARDEVIDINTYQQHFCVTHEALKHAKPDTIVMHPGPMNRDLEISSGVADSAQSTIFEQVQNGVAIRMAILHTLLN